MGVSEDCLTRMNSLHSPRHDDSFTGMELMDCFFKDVAHDILQRHCRFYVCNYDYQPNVNKHMQLAA